MSSTTDSVDCERLLDMIFAGVENDADVGRPFKACRRSSPVYRLVVCLTLMLSADRGLVRFAQIWLAFVARLREHWEAVEYIRGCVR